MKTTFEIPDPLFRKAKARAAERGQSLKDFVTEALAAKLSSSSRPSASTPVRGPDWMQGFGELRHLSKETARIQRAMKKEFDVVEAENRD